MDPAVRGFADLLSRLRAIEGRTLGELAALLDLPAARAGVRSKGKVGELIERALGASGGARAQHDFPALGLELKTIPVDRHLRPRESTYVCRISLPEAERACWETSWTRRKLVHVLFVPIVERTLIGPPVFWRPTPEQESILRADFDDLMGAIGSGDIESLDARRGTYLQLRPKAQNGRERTLVWTPEGEMISTVPRGLYLRARFTAALLRPGPPPSP